MSVPLPKKTNQNLSKQIAWLAIIDDEPPKFTCPVIDSELMSPCNMRGCVLWNFHPKSYNCLGALSGMKSVSSEERLQATSAAQREKRGTLKAAAEGKLSYYDLAHAYGLSRQRVEGYVSQGANIMETLAPLFHEIDFTDEDKVEPTRRIGSPTLFTHTSSVSYCNKTTGDVTRVCICCESVIEPDDDELVIAVVERSEVAWCSRECAKELPIDAYLISNRYKRHWANIALGQDPIDERSRVREITPERMENLKQIAVNQGYKLPDAQGLKEPCSEK